jgi:hypothetical protein
MKQKIYQSQSVMFCPHCHKRVHSPMQVGGKIIGTMNITCGECNKGRVVIKGEENGK